MDAFDADFPGHYLRTVRRVHVSLVALVPPDRGVRATLIGSGISRVVTGGDTSWELQLPKPTNPFDFAIIADVLFTVDYTALQDFSYRHQVITQLDDRRSAERAISVRDAFPDQWYALAQPGVVGSDARRATRCRLHPARGQLRTEPGRG